MKIAVLDDISDLYSHDPITIINDCIITIINNTRCCVVSVIESTGTVKVVCFRNKNDCTNCHPGRHERS